MPLQATHGAEQNPFHGARGDCVAARSPPVAPTLVPCAALRAIEPRMKVEKSEFSLTDPKVIAGIGALVATIVAIPLFPKLFEAANSQY